VGHGEEASSREVETKTSSAMFLLNAVEVTGAGVGLASVGHEGDEVDPPSSVSTAGDTAAPAINGLLEPARHGGRETSADLVCSASGSCTGDVAAEVPGLPPPHEDGEPLTKISGTPSTEIAAEGSGIAAVGQGDAGLASASSASDARLISGVIGAKVGARAWLADGPSSAIPLPPKLGLAGGMLVDAPSVGEHSMGDASSCVGLNDHLLLSFPPAIVDGVPSVGAAAVDISPAAPGGDISREVKASATSMGLQC